MTQPARATSVETLHAKFAMGFGEEKKEQGLALKLRSTDVVIAPFGKSGTTWVQQIVHCLRTRGDMDFDDISRVVPWIETSPVLGIDLDTEQKANPRAFKSHLAWDAIPKGGRYIVTIRDPKDALYSMYKFMEGWFFEPGSIALDNYAREFFIKNREYWKHLGSWRPLSESPRSTEQPPRAKVQPRSLEPVPVFCLKHTRTPGKGLASFRLHRRLERYSGA